ncbi:MAG: hypothetical protein K2Q21_02205 [Chitinophagaceae bacterium]|nr:hypothetical protein [Chitinophagaceae bacterium]
MQKTTKQLRINFVPSILFFLYLFGFVLNVSANPDLPFKQAVSVKYTVAPNITGSSFKKVLVDYNDVVYVLSSQGLLRINDHDLVKDLRYTPLSRKQPVDIAIQEKVGNLYYLLNDKVLTNGYAGVPYSILPSGRFNKLAVDEKGNIFLTGNQSVGFVIENKLVEFPLSSEEQIRNIYINQGVFYALGSKTIYRVKDKTLIPIFKADDIKEISFQKNEIFVGTEKGYYAVHNVTGNITFTLKDKLPAIDINCLLFVNNNLWAGTTHGAFKKNADNSFRYYASKRWLNEDTVISMASDSKGNVYCLTKTGINKIEFSSYTLAQKANFFQDKIRQRHIRYGLISEVFFQNSGDLSTAEMMDTDNDGLWSSFYLGSQAFRYAVTKDKTAKRYAWETFEAFERLLTINPLKGFPSRTFERIEYRNSDPEAWRKSQNPEWEWKGTTSSDEFVGHIFASAVMSRFAAETPSEKKRVADFVDKILTHIIENNYYFVDADGKPTHWGRWNPEYINWYPESISDRKLGSTTIIAGLQLGYALTGKSIYKTEAFRLMNDHNYLKNILIDCNKIQITPGYVFMGANMGDGWNHSDDEMSFLAYWVLYHFAFNDTLKKKFSKAIVNHWNIEMPERDGLWNLITKGTAGVYDKESTLWYLKEFPMDMINWTIKNSDRRDLELLSPNLRDQKTKTLLPYSEQPTHRHNANPFFLDGGDDGHSELAGDEYLLPYWMARYLKVIQ